MIKLDEDVLSQINELGYTKEYLIKSLLKKEFNYATATYFLMLNPNQIYINPLVIINKIFNIIKLL